MGRHDVRGRPALDDADVERRPRVEVLQVLDAQDLVGQLDDRAAALLGRDAGVRGLALDVSGTGRPLRAVLRPPSASGGSSTST